MNVNPLIELIKDNFNNLDSLRQLQTAIECMIEEREYMLKLINGESPEWPLISSVNQINKQK
jgi:hypothetical protein